MRYITFEDEHRQRHFDFFLAMDQPHSGLTADVDITNFAQLVRKSADLRFSPALIYLLSRVAHELPVFRQRIRKGGQVVEHDRVDPSFTVPTKASTVFSFCTVEYHADPKVFHQAAIDKVAEMQENPSFSDEPGRDDYLFMSAMPWVSFTSLTHAMPIPADSVPRISWGKYYDREDRRLMPLAVQAHHGLVDGRDIGAYYQLIQRFLDHPEEIFADFT